MAYLPIFVDLAGRRCVVIGGGEVANRKVLALIDAAARVCVISPTLVPGLRELAAAGAIEYLAREWKPSDLEGSALVFAATDDAELHRKIAREARSLGIPINVADDPDLCDFIAPAVMRRGDLQVAVSTSGAGPAMAARVRRDIEAAIGPEYEVALGIIRAARSYLREHEPEAERRAQAIRALAFSDIIDRVRAADWSGIDRLLRDHTGVESRDLGLVFVSADSLHPARIV